MAYTNPYYDPKLIYQNASSGASAGQALGNPDQFYMNDANMLGAVGSGFATGGPIGGLVAGVSNFFGQDAKLKRSIENVNTDFNTTFDAYGRPVYQGAEIGQGIQDFQGLMEATRPGAHAMRPRRRRQAERKAGELFGAIKEGQQSYNQAEVGYRNRMLQYQDYMDRQDDQSRLSNLYRY